MEKASGRRSLQRVTLEALLALLSPTFGHIPEAPIAFTIACMTR
jgi:hypothetical protein